MEIVIFNFRTKKPASGARAPLDDLDEEQDVFLQRLHRGLRLALSPAC